VLRFMVEFRRNDGPGKARRIGPDASDRPAAQNQLPRESVGANLFRMQRER
jgi:hypothetical protein